MAETLLEKVQKLNDDTHEVAKEIFEDEALSVETKSAAGVHIRVLLSHLNGLKALVGE